METIQVTLSRHKVHGTHIAAPTSEISREVITLPLDDCRCSRPDLGEYSPIVNSLAVERTLRARGYLFALPSDERFYYSI